MAKLTNTIATSRIATTSAVLGLAVGAALMLFVAHVKLSRRFIRDALKGKISDGKRGSSHAWKKKGDPALASDVPPIWLFLDKLKWSSMSYLGRVITPLLYPSPLHLNFYDVNQHPGVKGMVALTVDDCFVRQGESHSLMKELRDLLTQTGNKLTFFLTLCYSDGAWQEKEIRKYVADGHELANHCREDREYDEDAAESFEHDLDATDDFIRRMTNSNQQCRWFRAPSGNVSPAMEMVLQKRGMINVMLDCYANDPHIPDANFIARTMCHGVTDGSILVIHMPEKGFREWDFQAIKLILEELCKRGLRSVTLSELEAAAVKTS